MSREDQLLTSSEQSYAGHTPLLGHRAELIVVVLLLTAGMLALAASPAAANRVSAPQLISEPDHLPPFESTEKCGSKPTQQDWEFETSLSVNPTNSANLATAWIQDYDDAIAVGFSTNGGKRWHNVVPPTTPCTGGLTKFGTGPEFSAFDPWLSFGPSLGPTHAKGIAYLSSNLASPPVNEMRHFAVIVNRSLDGGKTWSAPVVLDETETPLNIDGDLVIADPDPARTGYAYAVWQKGDEVAAATRNQYVSHTTDEGVRWSKPKEIPSETGSIQLLGRLLALPGGMHGTLVDVVGETPPQPGVHKMPPEFKGPTMLMARRSTDLGETWSAPTTIAVADKNFAVTSSVSLAPDRRTIYVSWWQASPAPPTFNLMYAKSTDFGETWSAPKAIGAAVDRPLLAPLGGTAPALPGLAVAPDGTLGVTFYDHRNEEPGKEPPRITDYWLRSSHDEGSSWEEDHLAGPFAQTSAPSADGTLTGPGFIGDYQGIAPIAGGFANTFVLAKPLGGANFELGSPPTDVFFDKVRTHRGHRRHPRFGG